MPFGTLRIAKPLPAMFKRKHKISSIIALVFLVSGITGFSQNSISDEHSIVEFVIGKMWPIVVIVSCIFSFIHTFGYDKKEKKWKVFISFLTFGVILFMIFSFCFQGTINLINSNIGQSKRVIVQGNILSTESKKHKAGNLTFELKVINRNDTIKLKVDELYFDKYKNTSFFNEEMNEGVLGFLYKRN